MRPKFKIGDEVRMLPSNSLYYNMHIGTIANVQSISRFYRTFNPSDEWEYEISTSLVFREKWLFTHESEIEAPTTMILPESDLDFRHSVIKRIADKVKKCTK